MKISFLGQGFEEKSENAVGNYLLKYLRQNNFHTFTGISAFASEAGIFGLSEYIQSAKENFDKLTLIVGVDQEGTSKEALLEIMNLNIDGYVFYQPEQPIFHPKIYLFEGTKENALIIGSSNLTARGLFANIESSLLIEFESSDSDAMRLIEELKAYYKTLFEFTDPNLFIINNEVINNFISQGIVPDETSRRNFYKKRDSGTSQSASTPAFPKRGTAKIPSTFPTKRRNVTATSSSISTATAAASSVHTSSVVSSPTTTMGRLVWNSGPLTERDLNIPRGSNTNITGSMLFKKGRTEGNIDQRHYFRDDVFASLPWATDPKPSLSHYERATAFIRLKIMGIDHGRKAFAISHNSNRRSRSYEQRNSMTSIAWGESRNLIARRDLIGKTAKLYKDPATNDYTLIID